MSFKITLISDKFTNPDGNTSLAPLEAQKDRITIRNAVVSEINNIQEKINSLEVSVLDVATKEDLKNGLESLKKELSFKLTDNTNAIGDLIRNQKELSENLERLSKREALIRKLIESRYEALDELLGVERSIVRQNEKDIDKLYIKLAELSKPKVSFLTKIWRGIKRFFRAIGRFFANIYRDIKNTFKNIFS